MPSEGEWQEPAGREGQAGEVEAKCKSGWQAGGKVCVPQDYRMLSRGKGC